MSNNQGAFLAVIVAATMTLSACSADSDSDLSTNDRSNDLLPTLVRNSERATAAHQALTQGKLHLDPAGCLRIADDNGPFVIWHHDSRIERTPDGRIRITDGFTGNTAYVGDEIALGGSGGPVAPRNVTPAIPVACATGNYWMAGQLMSEAERQEMLERERSRKPVPSPGAS